MNEFDLNAKTQERLYMLSAVASAMRGHMMNAICDLDSGTKAQAAETLRRGMKLLDDHYDAMAAHSKQINAALTAHNQGDEIEGDGA